MTPLALLSSVAVLDCSLEGWTLLEPDGEGPRVFRHSIAFARPFSAPPVVHVGIVGLDISKDDNARVRVRAVDITETGFVLHAETWWGTKMWSVEVSWMAVGS
jgi:hypothetical protein